MTSAGVVGSPNRSGNLVPTSHSPEPAGAEGYFGTSPRGSDRLSSALNGAARLRACAVSAPTHASFSGMIVIRISMSKKPDGSVLPNSDAGRVHGDLERTKRK